MLATPQTVQSLAASGNVTITVPVPNDERHLEICVLVEYAAVAATTGITASFQVSPDGTNFVNSNVKNLVLQPAATKVGVASAMFSLQDAPQKVDAGPIESIKVTLTNADATNAAVVAVLAEKKSALGF